MVVNRVEVIDSRQGETITNVIRNPSWPEIEEAIRDMDGATRNQTFLFVKEDHHMFVGGGGGKFVAYVTFNNEQYFNLTTPSASDAVTEVMIGYQETEYPEQLCVNAETVIAAAAEFAETGGLASSLQWSE